MLQNDKSDEVREAAATAIGNDKFVVPAQQYASDLAEALKDPHVGTRIAVAGALRSMGEHARPAFSALFAAAKNPKEALLVRVAAVHVLGRHAKDDPQTLPLLLALAAPADNPPRRCVRLPLTDWALTDQFRTRPSSCWRAAWRRRTSSCARRRPSRWDRSARRRNPPGLRSRNASPTRRRTSALRNHLIRLAGTLGKTNPEAVTALTAAAREDESTENRIAAIQELGELGPLAKSAPSKA